MYRIIVSPSAKNQLRKISKKLHKNAIAQTIEELKPDPFLGKSLTRELTGKYSYRVGASYRIIYKIEVNDKVVEVISAGHGSDVYR